MRCHRCRAVIEDGRKTCPNCGVLVRRKRGKVHLARSAVREGARGVYPNYPDITGFMRRAREQNPLLYGALRFGLPAAVVLLLLLLLLKIL